MKKMQSDKYSSIYKSGYEHSRVPNNWLRVIDFKNSAVINFIPNGPEVKHHSNYQYFFNTNNFFIVLFFC